MFKQILIAVATCAAFAAPAQADTVLTFDGAGVMQNNHADGYTGIGDTYVQDGFTPPEAVATAANEAYARTHQGGTDALFLWRNFRYLGG